jgi:hypothetical protein
LKTTRSHKSSKDQTLLISLAESIGSTLGSIAAKAGAAQKALTKRKLTTKLEQEGKNLVRKGKKIARNLKKTRLARATRRSRPIKRATRRARARK